MLTALVVRVVVVVLVVRNNCNEAGEMTLCTCHSWLAKANTFCGSCHNAQKYAINSIPVKGEGWAQAFGFVLPNIKCNSSNKILL